MGVRASVRVVAALGLVASLFAVSRGNGYPATRLAVSASAAWLPSFGVGQVALVDGTTADVVAKVEINRQGASMQVVQSGSDAFVLDQRTGQVTRVDGATLATVSASPFGPSSTLQAFAGAGSLFLFDRARGALATLDATSLAIRKRSALSRTADSGSAVVDSTGQLWVIDGTNGAVKRFDGSGTPSSAAAIADPKLATLTLVEGHPVVIDTAGRAAVRPLDPRSGRLQAGTCLAGSGHPLKWNGSPTRQRVYFSDTKAGSLLVSDLDRRDCDAFIQLGVPGSALGPPLEAAGRVLVPDFDAAVVYIVDVDKQTAVSVPLPVPRRTHFDLLTQSGLVFYNDPTSQRAGVISLDGRAPLKAEKYNPNDPRGGLPGSQPTRKKKSPTSSPSRTQRTTSPPPTTSSESPASTGPRTTGQSTPPLSSDDTGGGGTRPATTSTTSTTSGGISLQIFIDAPPSPELNKPYVFELRAVGARHITAVSWTFGDKAMAAGLRVSHAYAEARTYFVTADAQLSDGASESATISVTVHASPVVQIVSMTCGTVQEDQPTPCSATFRNGTPKTYEWKVFAPEPDGTTIATSFLPVPSFIFADPTPDAGLPYRVTLVVDANYAEPRALDVTVGPAKPSGASVDCSPSDPLVGQEVRCTPTANGVVAQWKWSIVDGLGRLSQPATDATAPTYKLPDTPQGDYKVSVVASNRAGDSDPATTTFSVRDVTAGIDCFPKPLYVGAPGMSCTVMYNGWSDAWSQVEWRLADSTGVPVGAWSTTIPGLLGGQWRSQIFPSFTAPGVYRADVRYVDVFGGAQDIVVNGQIPVAAARHQLTVSVTGAGIVGNGGDLVCDQDHSPCAWVFGEGDIVHLSAAEADNNVLDKWGGVCSSASGGRCQVTIGDQDAAVSAAFVPLVQLQLTLTGGTGRQCTTTPPPTTTSTTHSTSPATSPTLTTSPATSPSQSQSPTDSSATSAGSTSAGASTGPAREMALRAGSGCTPIPGWGGGVNVTIGTTAANGCDIPTDQSSHDCTYNAKPPAIFHLSKANGSTSVTWVGCAPVTDHPEKCTLTLTTSIVSATVKATFAKPSASGSAAPALRLAGLVGIPVTLGLLFSGEGRARRRRRRRRPWPGPIRHR